MAITVKAFKVCSCGETYHTEQSFLRQTTSIGVISTLSYMAEDLELRNCLKCLTTLTRKIAKPGIEQSTSFQETRELAVG